MRLQFSQCFLYALCTEPVKVYDGLKCPKYWTVCDTSNFISESSAAAMLFVPCLWVNGSGVIQPAEHQRYAYFELGLNYIHCNHHCPLYTDSSSDETLCCYSVTVQPKLSSVLLRPLLCTQWFEFKISLLCLCGACGHVCCVTPAHVTPAGTKKWLKWQPIVNSCGICGRVSFRAQNLFVVICCGHSATLCLPRFVCTHQCNHFTHQYVF